MSNVYLTPYATSIHAEGDISGGSGLVITYDDTEGKYSASYNDVVNAVSQGIVPILLIESEGNYSIYTCVQYGEDSGDYGVTFTYPLSGDTMTLVSTDPDAPFESEHEPA